MINLKEKFKIRDFPGSPILEKGVATHFNILAWRISQTEEPGELQSMGLQIVGHD